MQKGLIRSEVSELHLRSRRISKDQSREISKAKSTKMAEEKSAIKESGSCVSDQCEVLPDGQSLTTDTEPIQPEKPVIDMVHFKQVDHDDKLDLIMAAINKVNTNFYYKFEEVQRSLTNKDDGIIPRMEKIEKWYETTKGEVGQIPEMVKTTEEASARLDAMEEQLPVIEQLKKSVEQLGAATAELEDDMTLLKGVLQTQDKKLMQAQEEVVALKKRSMKNNIIINGILGDSKEETADMCKEKVLELMRTQMKMTVDDGEVIVAHRLGKIQPNLPYERSIVVRCQHDLRERVFNFNFKSARIEER